MSEFLWTLDKAREAAEQTLAAAFAERREALPLWPAPYGADSAEALTRFVRECCWTYNEANSVTELIPDLAYVRWFCARWHHARVEGRALICEKSRRLIMSWVVTACELWAMGLRRERRIVAGLDYPKAANHVWRHWWLFEELRKRRPALDLKPSTPREGNVQAMRVQQVMLPNGSLVEALNQLGQSFQGAGYAGVRMEEFSLYRSPRYMWGQARIVTQGKPGTVGGNVVAITNASPNTEWQEIKKCPRDAN